MQKQNTLHFLCWLFIVVPGLHSFCSIEADSVWWLTPEGLICSLCLGSLAVCLCKSISLQSTSCTAVAPNSGRHNERLRIWQLAVSEGGLILFCWGQSECECLESLESWKLPYLWIQNDEIQFFGCGSDALDPSLAYTAFLDFIGAFGCLSVMGKMMSGEMEIDTFVFYLIKCYAKDTEALWERKWEKEVSHDPMWNASECMIRMLGGADGWKNL